MEVQAISKPAVHLPLPPVAGYSGVYTNKATKPGSAGGVREGSATFFRASRFGLAARRDLTLKEFFPAEVGEKKLAV